MNRPELGTPGHAMPDAAMDALVRQSLAAEEARKLALDRSPAVRMAVDEATREILATAYFDHLASKVEKPTAEDIHAYYLGHPELFQDRRLYSFKEIALPDDAAVRNTLTEVVPHADGVDDIAHRLRRRGIEFQVTSSIRAPESLPLDMLPRLAAAHTGDVVTYYGGGVAYVAQIIGILRAPIGEDAARDRIAKFLENQRARQLVADEDRRLRSAARIEIGPDVHKLIKQPPATVTMESIPAPESLASQLATSARLPIVQ